MTALIRTTFGFTSTADEVLAGVDQFAVDFLDDLDYRFRYYNPIGAYGESVS